MTQPNETIKLHLEVPVSFAHQFLRSATVCILILLAGVNTTRFMELAIVELLSTSPASISQTEA